MSLYPLCQAETHSAQVIPTLLPGDPVSKWRQISPPLLCVFLWLVVCLSLTNTSFSVATPAPQSKEFVLLHDLNHKSKYQQSKEGIQMQIQSLSQIASTHQHVLSPAVVMCKNYGGSIPI